MVKSIDFYEHWNKNRIAAHRKRFLHREKISLKILSHILKKGATFLDAGCGNGMFLQRVKEKFPEVNLRGADYSQAEVREARKQGLDVKRADFGKNIPFKSSEFDAVYAAELIEHLYDPDLFLEESNRVLKKGGYLIITTPNLCAWFNRVLMPLGIQPLFLEPSTKSKLVGAGFLKRFKQDPWPVGHIRIFTLAALQDMLFMYGFKPVAVKGANYDEGFPSSVLWLDNIFTAFPKLAAHLVIVARKVKDAS